MRGVPAWRKLSYTSAKSPTPHSVQHPSTVSALRADPPSPTRRRALHGERSGVRWSVRAFLKAGRAVLGGPCEAFVGLGCHPPDWGRTPPSCRPLIGWIEDANHGAQIVSAGGQYALRAVGGEVEEAQASHAVTL
ncbi:hypothetical protein EOC93_33110, partial [Mesorhizobium sp. M6A.T.Ce.TU.002.03.1.1]